LSVLQELVDALTREARVSIAKQVDRFEMEFEAYVRRLVIKNIRVVAMGSAATALVIIGIFFSLYGVGTYLGQFTPPGISWLIIGILGVAGGAGFLAYLRK
jgi:hypothetical protein